MTDEDEAKNTRIPSVVLVHGAFADGSSWRHVIAILEDEGFRVTAVQNPQTSLREDVAMTRRVIEAQQGPVVLVGHGYGGAVITAAAVGVANVNALVYVAAFAPGAGERLQALLMSYPSEMATALVSDSEGYLSIDRTKFAKVFAADVPERERRVLAAVQTPINGRVFTHVFDTPAWIHVPAWYLVATEDQAINPELQRMFATRMDATTHEVKASHVPFVSNPVAVVRVIRAAAASIDRTAKPLSQAVARLHVEHVVQGASAKPTIH
jgi:pimeloyl-ACP methyl ester carboxylesterase